MAWGFQFVGSKFDAVAYSQGRSEEGARRSAPPPRTIQIENCRFNISAPLGLRPNYFFNLSQGVMFHQQPHPRGARLAQKEEL